jgi:hypothetical protein
LSELTASFNNLTMADTQYAILVLVPAIIAGLYFLLHQWRHKAFAHIPSPLKRNLFLGHLGYIGEEQQKLGSGAHYGHCPSIHVQDLS